MWVAEKKEDDSWTWRWMDSQHGPPSRVAHTQAVYNDSVVYIFGGRAGITMQEQAMNDLWKFDSSTETWSLVQSDLEQGDAPPEERSFHKMMCVGSNLYVFGGCSANHGRLADIHRYDILKNTWHAMGASSLLRGRGGANFLTLAARTRLGVVGGFCGEESNDGHAFHLESEKWEEKGLTEALTGLRPRSVCVSASFPSTGVSVIFGGEVDPSAKGHEGAGGFENDVVLLDETTGKYLETIPANSVGWPETRGWSDSDGLDGGKGLGQLYVFGGLSGDDANPRRLDDLWRLDIQKAE
jgi:hypothetical protein